MRKGSTAPAPPGLDETDVLKLVRALRDIPLGSGTTVGEELKAAAQYAVLKGMQVKAAGPKRGRPRKRALGKDDPGDILKPRPKTATRALQAAGFHLRPGGTVRIWSGTNAVLSAVRESVMPNTIAALKDLEAGRGAGRMLVQLPGARHVASGRYLLPLWVLFARTADDVREAMRRWPAPTTG